MTADLDALVARLNANPITDRQALSLVNEAAAAITELRDALRDMTSDRDSWEQQNDDRVSDVLEQATRAERAEARIAELEAALSRAREPLGVGEVEAVLDKWTGAPYPTGATSRVQQENDGLRQLVAMAAEAQRAKGETK